MSVNPEPHRHSIWANRQLSGRPVAVVIHASATIRQALMVTLDLAGLDVIATADIAEASLLAPDLRPAVIIVDSTMSGLEGSALVDCLRSTIVDDAVPIIIFARQQAQRRSDRWATRGVHYVDREPGSVERLLEVIEMVGENHHSFA
jgi:DNA-binding NarL/FixJ family response regulator